MGGERFDDEGLEFFGVETRFALPSSKAIHMSGLSCSGKMTLTGRSVRFLALPVVDEEGDGAEGFPERQFGVVMLEGDFEIVPLPIIAVVKMTDRYAGELDLIEGDSGCFFFKHPVAINVYKGPHLEHRGRVFEFTVFLRLGFIDDATLPETSSGWNRHRTQFIYGRTTNR